MTLKFRCERDDLLNAVSVAARATAGSAAGRAALTGVHFDLKGETLTVTGSDLNLTLSATAAVVGESDGSAVVPARLLTDVVRAVAPGGIEVVADDSEATLVAGSSKFVIRMIEAEDYPQLVFVHEGDESATSASFGTAVAFSGAEFRSALGQVVKSASGDDSRPILTGVLMTVESESGLRLVSTDSYRMTVRDLEGSSIPDDRQKVLVPGRALGEVQKLMSDTDEVVLKLAENYAQFTVGDVKLTTTLIPGEFPNYQGLIPTGHANRLTAERGHLLEVVKRVRLLAQDSTPVRLVMSSEGLEVIAVTQDVGKASESMQAHYEGEDLMVAFNPGYLIDGMEAATGDEITLETADAVKPALLRSVGDDSFLYLLMPVRVS